MAGASLGRTLTIIIRTRGIGRSIAQIGALTLGVGGLGLAIYKSIKIAADFEVQMKRMQAVTESLESQMGGLKNTIFALTSESIFNLDEVSKATKEFLKIGFQTEDAMMAMGDAINLATAGEATLGDATARVALTIKQFNFGVEESARVANVLAKGANISAADVSSFGQALQYVGPIAADLGMTLEETTATVALLTNAGLEASMSGRVYRQFLMHMMNPSAEAADIIRKLGIEVFDTSGKIRKTGAIFEDMRTGMEGLTESTKRQYLGTLLGTRSMVVYSAVMNASTEELDRLEQSLISSTVYAQDAADVMRDSLNYQLTEFKNKMEVAAAYIGDPFVTRLKDIVTNANDAADAISDLNNQQLEFIDASFKVVGDTKYTRFWKDTFGFDNILDAVTDIFSVPLGPAGKDIYDSMVKWVEELQKMGQEEFIHPLSKSNNPWVDIGIHGVGSLGADTEVKTPWAGVGFHPMSPLERSLIGWIEEERQKKATEARRAGDISGYVEWQKLADATRNEFEDAADKYNIEAVLTEIYNSLVKPADAADNLGDELEKLTDRLIDMQENVWKTFGMGWTPERLDKMMESGQLSSRLFGQGFRMNQVEGQNVITRGGAIQYTQGEYAELKAGGKQLGAAGTDEDPFVVRLQEQEEKSSGAEESSDAQIKVSRSKYQFGRSWNKVYNRMGI